MNPNAKDYTGGPPGLMDVEVDLDVPPGKTVRWTLDIGAVSTEIKLDKMVDPPTQQQRRQSSGELIKAPVSYEFPSPINRVYDYVIAGEIKGSSTAYTQRSAKHFPSAANIDTSLTSLAWSGPLPVIFKGAYVTAFMPALTAVETQPAPASPFDFGWNPVSLRTFHAVEEIGLPIDYQINSGSQVSEGFGGWEWSADGSQGIYNATGTGSSLTEQAKIHRRLFLAGILLGLVSTALFAGAQSLLVVLGERKN